MVSPGTSVKPTYTSELPIYFSSNIPLWQQCDTLSKFKTEILKKNTRTKCAAVSGILSQNAEKFTKDGLS